VCGSRRSERSAQGRIDVSVGADDHQATVVQPASHELQEQQRRLVGSVQVVEHDDEGPALSGLAEKGSRRFEEAETRALAFHRRRL
jgi:hypothetical protein